MIKDKVNLKGASGKLTAYKISNGVKSKLWTRKNTILPNAAELLALYISGDTSARLTTIRVYEGATLIAEGALTNRAHPDTGVALLEALFDEASFDHAIDNAKLGPDDPGTLGNFAETTFDSTTKNGSEQLLVSWEITFTNLV
jgi:hypothetical protein